MKYQGEISVAGFFYEGRVGILLLGNDIICNKKKKPQYFESICIGIVSIKQILF